MYTKINFIDGETTPIDSTNLNHMEDGIIDASKRYSGNATVTSASIDTNFSGTQIDFTSINYSADATADNFKQGDIVGLKVPAGVYSVVVSLIMFYDNGYVGKSKSEIYLYDVSASSASIVASGGNDDDETNPKMAYSQVVPVDEGDYFYVKVYGDDASHNYATVRLTCTAL